MNQLERYYELLGVRPGAPFREVRQAYLHLVRTWHPDRFADDPQRQRLAQERLKAINEAYRELEAALSAGSRPGQRTAGTVVSPPKGSATASPRQRPETRPPAGSGGLVRFLSFWPNALFLVYLLCAARVAAAGRGLPYFLQMAVVPFMFALLCNSRPGARQSLWKAYLASICIFAVLLAADVSMMRKGGRDAWAPRSPESGETAAPTVTVPFGGTLPEELPGGPDRRAPGGSRQVTPPTPPTAPETPTSPSAPEAPVVPRGK